MYKHSVDKKMLMMQVNKFIILMYILVYIYIKTIGRLGIQLWDLKNIFKNFKGILKDKTFFLV